MKTMFAVVVVMAMFGCEKATSDRNHAAGVNDQSHTPAQATAHGAPSIDKTWSPVDFVTFDSYLAELSSSDYPNLSSSNSTALFMKVIDSIEQPVLEKSDIPLDSRIGLLLQMLKACNNVLKRYTRAHNSGTDYSAEVAYLLGRSLSTARQGLVLMDEFIPTIDPHDGKYEVRMQGLQRMRDGMATVLDGVVISMKETHVYSIEERSILAKCLIAEAPTILDHLDSNVRREFEVKVKELMSSEADSEIKQLLANLSETIMKEGSNKRMHQTPKGAGDL